MRFARKAADVDGELDRFLQQVAQEQQKFNNTSWGFGKRLQPTLKNGTKVSIAS